MSLETTAVGYPSGEACRRRIRVGYLNSWVDGVERADEYLERLPTVDLLPRVASPDRALLQKARLDCDWYGENARCFAALTHPSLEFLPAFVCGPRGVAAFGALPREKDEERWLIAMGHQPQMLGPMAAKVFAWLHSAGVRNLYYAFDEASRFMPCFREIAPFLDVLVHDEDPLDGAGARVLRRGCLQIRRSWVANFVPFSVPFNEAPEEKILFLGSQPGLTPHRQRQIEFLRARFKDRFVASCDHSVSMASRPALNRFKVGLCPEGRKFATPAMGRSHTDRPFWSGCLGLIPVSENSVAGNRLDELAAEGLILRYPHGDLKKLEECCEKALSMPVEQRRRIHTHFNQSETIGSVVAAAIHEAAGERMNGSATRANPANGPIYHDLPR